MCVCARAHACVRACVHVCLCLCVSERDCVSVRVWVCVGGREGVGAVECCCLWLILPLMACVVQWRADGAVGLKSNALLLLELYADGLRWYWNCTLVALFSTENDARWPCLVSIARREHGGRCK